jgi:hypothetical protein
MRWQRYECHWQILSFSRGAGWKADDDKCHFGGWRG